MRLSRNPHLPGVKQLGLGQGRVASQFHRCSSASCVDGPFLWGWRMLFAPQGLPPTRLDPHVETTRGFRLSEGQAYNGPQRMPLA